MAQWLIENPYSDDEGTVEVTNCIMVIESPAQREAEHKRVTAISSSTPTQECHFSTKAAQSIWICNSVEEEGDAPQRRLSNNLETSSRQKEGSRRGALPRGGRCKEEPQ